MPNPTAAELWRPIAGLEGQYEVSSQGRVRSLDRYVFDRRTTRRRLRGRILRPHPNNFGHLTVSLPVEPSRRRRQVSILVAHAFLGAQPSGSIVRHLNDIPGDNRVENLAYGSYSDNQYDSVRNETHHLSQREVCPRGHPLRLPNLVAKKYREVGHRACLACNHAEGHVRKQPGLDMQTESDRCFARIELMGGGHAALRGAVSRALEPDLADDCAAAAAERVLEALAVVLPRQRAGAMEREQVWRHELRDADRSEVSAWVAS